MADKHDELIALLRSAESLAKELNGEFLTNTLYRANVAKEIACITRQVQAPQERIWDLCFSPNVVSCVRIALDAGWLDAVASAGRSGITTTELAAPTAADPSLVSRVMRLVARANFVDEVGVKTFAANSTTTLLVQPGMRHELLHMTDSNFKTASMMPYYFANLKYQTPPDDINGPYTYAEGVPFWKNAEIRPHLQENFDWCMAAQKSEKKNWFDSFPLEKFSVASDEEILLVDCGGGLGHDLIAFDAKRKSLKMPGKLILQDIPRVTENVTAERRKALTVIPHDFFNPQPESCIHARVYYFRTILHDWADSACVDILKRARDAMKPGYSTLLINDFVLPDKDCPTFEAVYDIAMMAMHSGKERTAQEWRDLIAQVEGLQIVKVWPIDEGANFESVTEIIRVA